MTYQVVKTYGHDIGLSCCFRQHRASSHCQLLHGYALAFEITFEAEELDCNNWVIDFGSLKLLKKDLVEMFDHTMVLANDDPHKEHLIDSLRGIADIKVLPKVGCEAFAELVFVMAERHLALLGENERVKVVSVKVSEHGANSSVYKAV